MNNRNNIELDYEKIDISYTYTNKKVNFSLRQIELM